MFRLSRTFLAVTAVSLWGVGCPSPTTPPREVASAETAEESREPSASQPTSLPSSAATVMPADNAIDARVADATARLSATPGGQRMAEAIGAHGGLRRWFANGPLQFRFRYVPRQDRAAIDTIQLIDTFSARAAHRLTETPGVQFGWTGSTAWVSDPDADLSTNPRFWSLTPYYFVGVPFVLADPGVTLALDGEEEFEERAYDRVRATFGEGVGDAPDDYYIVLVDQETDRIGGVRYVVSYQGFFPDGGTTPEKLMMYDGAQQVDGITFPQTFRTFALEPNGTPTDVVTDSEMSAVSFAPETLDTAFAMPTGAFAVTGF
jgi:hypothetical protein